MALIPLVIFTNHRDLMGALVNRAHTKILIILVTAIIIGLNIYLLYGVLAGTGG
jgi:manganese transport protein